MAKIKVDIDPRVREKYRKGGFWGDSTLLDYWNLSVKSFPEKTAAVDSRGGSYTYSQLDDRSSRLAAYLVKSGVEPGDVVSVQVPNWVEFTLCYIAILKAGAVINPLMPKFRESELLHRMEKCKSKVLFTVDVFHGYENVKLAQKLKEKMDCLQLVIVAHKGDSAEQRYEGTVGLSEILATTEPLKVYVHAEADDVAVILFTSGTEGKPKGVMLTHNNLLANIRGYVSMTTISSNDVMFLPVPVAHATGLMYGVTLPYVMGMTSVMLEKFDPDTSLQLISKHRCTVLLGPTVIGYDLLRTIDAGVDYDLSSIRYYFSGGSAIPKDMIEKGLKYGIKILGVYGQTESAPHCIMSPTDPVELVLTTDGRPIPGMEVKIVDNNGNEVPYGTEGEEWSRGPSVCVGYLDEPEMTAEAFTDGWLHSGDLCVMDENHYVKVTGRKKDIIIRGGENISSIEVEDILLHSPCVKEVAVVAYPDDRLGERSCAYVVPSEYGKQWSLEEMRAFMTKLQVAKYKWPERLEIVDSLPYTAAGKVEKYKLRQMIKEKVEAEKKAQK